MQGFTILYLTIVAFEIVYAINDDVKPINVFLRPEPVLKSRWRRSLLGPMPYGYFQSPIEPWAEEMNHVPDSSIDSYRLPVWAFRQPLPAAQNNFKNLFEHAGPFEKEIATSDVSHGLTPENGINKLLSLHMANFRGGEYKQEQQVLPEDNISVQLLANIYHHYPDLPTVEPTVVYELNMPIVVVQESKKQEEAPFKSPVPWFFTTPRQDTRNVETIIPVLPSTTMGYRTTPNVDITPTEDYNPTTTVATRKFRATSTTEQPQTTVTDSYSVFIDDLETSTPTESAWISNDEEKTSYYNSNSEFVDSEEGRIESDTPTTNEAEEVERITESYIGEIVDNISQEFPSNAHNVISNDWDLNYLNL